MIDNTLPPSVCLRVTRSCNAKCDFCLAPPDGLHVPLDQVFDSLKWMVRNGIQGVNLCGGEPTVRTDLDEIIQFSRKLDLRVTLTTNGITLVPRVVSALARADAKVKISLHGPPRVHNYMLGVDCYDKVDASIQTLKANSVFVSIQTVVTRLYPRVISFSIEYSLANGITKVSFIPFIPRGRGRASAGTFMLPDELLDEVRHEVLKRRDLLSGLLDVRLLDFRNRSFYVVETDGRLSIQAETESADVFIGDAI